MRSRLKAHRSIYWRCGGREALGVRYFGPAMPNAQDSFIDCLVEIVSKISNKIIDKKVNLNNNQIIITLNK